MRFVESTGHTPLADKTRQPVAYILIVDKCLPWEGMDFWPVCNNLHLSARCLAIHKCGHNTEQGRSTLTLPPIIDVLYLIHGHMIIICLLSYHRFWSPLQFCKHFIVHIYDA